MNVTPDDARQGEKNFHGAIASDHLDAQRDAAGGQISRREFLAGSVAATTVVRSIVEVTGKVIFSERCTDFTHKLDESIGCSNSLPRLPLAVHVSSSRSSTASITSIPFTVT